MAVITCPGPGPSFSAKIPGATQSFTSTIVGMHWSQYLTVVINTTTASAGNTVQLNINGITPSGFTYLLLASVTVASVTTTALMVGPGLPATANVSANVIVPDSVQLVMTVVGTVAYGIDFQTS